MGLDTTHNAWHGSYGSFHRFRCEVAKAAGLPPLELMDGFYKPLGGIDRYTVPTLYPGLVVNEISFSLREIDKALPISWECLNISNGLKVFLGHSDCDGEISPSDCKEVAESLQSLEEKIPEEWRENLLAFSRGCRLAASLGETLQFH